MFTKKGTIIAYTYLNKLNYISFLFSHYRGQDRIPKFDLRAAGFKSFFGYLSKIYISNLLFYYFIFLLIDVQNSHPLKNLSFPRKKEIYRKRYTINIIIVYKLLQRKINISNQIFTEK